MELKHIPLSSLKLSPLNVRKHGTVSGAELVPSIRSLGVLQPLLVRPNCEGFEIVAGQRRFNACLALEAEGEAVAELPCIVMADGDDATAIEASLAENVERLPMDAIDQFKAFGALITNGRSVADIAAHFGVTERLVEQRLALGNLHEPILNAYRREEVHGSDLQLLTMATARQQKAWWKLHRSRDGYAPCGRALRAWLFGGQDIPTTNALFDLADYPGSIVSDLFGDERYFGDAETFWPLQSKAIAALADRYSSEGWDDVVLCEVGEYWHGWNHVSTPKEQGGRVYVACSADGEVSVHEGYLTQKETERRRKQQQAGGDVTNASRPELTATMQNYLDLRRHSAVRVELLGQPGTALRLMLAHAICGSDLWQVRVEPQRADKADTDQSIADSTAQDSFNREAMEVRHLLGIEDGGDVVQHGYGGRDLAAIFARLLKLGDDEVLRILAYVMAETLQAGTATVELLGQLLSVDMRRHWQPDETFFDLLRDKEGLNAMVRELAGKPVAEAHATATAKAHKAILRDCLSGTRKARVADWLPRYMEFPMRAYTRRGGIRAIEAAKETAGVVDAA